MSQSIDPEEQAKIFGMYFLSFVLLCLLISMLVGCAARQTLVRGANCPADAPRIEVPKGCYPMPDHTKIMCPRPKAWIIKCGEEVNGRPSPK